MNKIILSKEEKETKNKIISLNTDFKNDLSENEKTPKDKNNKKYLKNKKDKNMIINKSSDDLLNKKRKLRKDEERKKIQNNKKEIKSHECISKDFILKNNDNFKNIFDEIWRSNIKSIKIDEEGKVTQKLSKDDLILEKCKKKAILKLLDSKEKIIISEKDLCGILSYDNINPNLLYFCLKKVNEEACDTLLKEYKYCFCNNIKIIDYFNDNKEIDINIGDEFNNEFPFKNTDEIIHALKEVIDTLSDLASEFDQFNSTHKLSQKEIKEIFSYKYNELRKDSEIKNKVKDTIEFSNKNYFHKLGSEFLKYYLKVEDLKYFEANQPFTFENNKILYLTSCIYNIYDKLTTNDNIERENLITIKGNYLNLVNRLISLLMSLIEDLNNQNIDEQFHSKIKFFYIIFEAKNPLNCDEIDFMPHIYKEINKFTEEKIKDFIDSCTKAAKLDKTRRGGNYKYSDTILTFKRTNGDINFNLDNYDNAKLFEMFSKEKKTESDILEYTWKNNTLNSFKNHNYLKEEDIKYLKELIKEIFKSKFWNEFIQKYCINDFIPDNYFQDDEFINQFIEKIIYLPYDINKHGYFAYTTADDLGIYISGYPYVKNYSDLSKYNLNRILQMAVSVIVIMHEAIHFLKRLLYFVTCNMVCRTTIIDEKREEAGNIFEEIVFGWKRDAKTKNVYLLKAMNILNIKTYQKGLEFAVNVFSSRKKVVKMDELDLSTSFKDYLSNFGLSEKTKFDNFIQENKNECVNAGKEFLGYNSTFNYTHTHKFCESWKK